MIHHGPPLSATSASSAIRQKSKIIEKSTILGTFEGYLAVGGLAELAELAETLSLTNTLSTHNYGVYSSETYWL